MNVIQIIKGRERWSMVADNIWDMIIGKSGKLPGKLDPEIIRLAEKSGKQFYTGVPQDLYPDNLDIYKKEMKDNNWDFGQDDEELLEMAMHPEQYRAYKSGKAKQDFEEDLARKKEAKTKKNCKEGSAAGSFEPKSMVIDINGEKFKVGVSYGDVAAATPATPAPVAAAPASDGSISEVIAPLEGKFMLTKDNTETALQIGDVLKEGDLVCYIESMKTYNAIVAEKAGKVVGILKANGDSIEEDDVLVQLS